METKYTDMISYTSFMESMIEEQQEMQDYVNECIILSNPNRKQVFTELAVFNEAKAGDKIKAFFARLKSFFSKIWQKFLEKLNAWSQDNKKYLETYKDIIIGKNVTLAEVKMTDHLNKGNDRIKRTFGKTTTFAMPIDFDINGKYKDLYNIATSSTNSDDSGEKEQENYNTYIKSQYEDVFKNADITDIKVSDDDDLNQVAPNLTKYFNGDEDLVTYSTSEIQDKMAVMFKSVYEFDDFYNGLDKIQKSYIAGMEKSEKAYDEAFTKMSNALKNVNTANQGQYQKAKTDATATATKVQGDYTQALNKAKNDAAKNEKEAKTESFIYSNVLKSYITEAEVTTKSASDNSNSAKTNSTVTSGGNKTDTSASKANAKATETQVNTTNATVKSNTDNAVQKATAADAGATDAKGIAGDNVENTAKLDKFQRISNNLIKAYSTARTTVFGSMLNALTSMKNDYMTIIRAHVNSHLGQVNDNSQNTNKTSV